MNKIAFIAVGSNIYSRSFVALPLYELEPDLVLPDKKIAICKIAVQFNYHELKADLEFTKEIRKIFTAKRTKNTKFKEKQISS